MRNDAATRIGTAVTNGKVIAACYLVDTPVGHVGVRSRCQTSNYVELSQGKTDLCATPIGSPNILAQIERAYHGAPVGSLDGIHEIVSPAGRRTRIIP